MNKLFKIQQKIVPEIVKTAQQRYNILRGIYYNQPIGRRALARILGLSERTIRNDLEFFEKHSLITISPAGTQITRIGEEFLVELDEYIKELRDISCLENKLEKILGIEKVKLVNGAVPVGDLRVEIGRMASQLLKHEIKDGDILAVTGGTTLARVASEMTYSAEPKDVTVVPGRGGLSEDVEIQANTIAAKIAKKLGGTYHLLHIPDNVAEENIYHITKEPTIKKTLEILKKANILIHGVGTAADMAARRGMKDAEIKDLLQAGAVGEAFGFYFNSKGEIIYSTTSVGLNLDDLESINKVIVIAGGENKAEAIISAVSSKYQDILITDEITARKIISLKGGEAEDRLVD
ncbi:sugar-binding transcriptional regulator [Halanaerobium congolense]|jgi:central glycolytic genes regulator|uniref:Central glycolytic genes regulator n=1 Tax=Halanaerobium congolense TaxID=54121 RepID=A0A1G7G2R0_9FIRM|nr:sugar-binding domain-containing protein [Halanaerobium congolense]KXS49225.1 MAG: central glycolytic protein regulator [Halanaerobium sp. T82-1]SDE82329.1 central glycolytic genes regulator [Halanaerobium congolense]SDG95723.1 central glycolytic genes regulator [Halanaerobium congolense]SDK46545.1 central glycolytic genes regulator [Halanaerobium congolense]SDM07758.1 central glycolytic genes regulator [Halanaerobium congolense]